MVSFRRRHRNKEQPGGRHVARFPGDVPGQSLSFSTVPRMPCRDLPNPKQHPGIGRPGRQPCLDDDSSLRHGTAGRASSYPF